VHLSLLWQAPTVFGVAQTRFPHDPDGWHVNVVVCVTVGVLAQHSSAAGQSRASPQHPAGYAQPPGIVQTGGPTGP
jgi:hypothetical protein